MLYDGTYHGGAAIGTTSPNASATAYVTEFCQQYYGLPDASSAAAAAALWSRYWHVPHIVNGLGDDHMSRNGIQRVAVPLAADVRNTGKPTAATVSLALAALATINSSLAVWPPLLEDVTAFGAAAVPAHRRDFFNAHLLLHTAVYRHATTALHAVVNATLTLAASDGAAAGAAAMHALAAAEAEMMALFAAERAAETGKWQGLYMHDRLVDMHRARRTITDAKAAIQGARHPRPLRPNGGYAFYNYQLAWTENYPYMYPNDTVAFTTFVRVACAGTYAGDQVGGCFNTVDGATFTTLSTTVDMALAGHPIHYTLDGTNPTVGWFRWFRWFR